MDSLTLTAVADEQVAAARRASSGRSARTTHGGHEHALHQTVLALAAGRALDDHESPGEATLQVLAGRVRLTVGEESWEGTTGTYLVIPKQRHRLDALEDSAILLTVVASAPQPR
jgi:quercetin dioxygenase-like cupin family protein